MASFTCTGLLPGECCKDPSDLFRNPQTQFNTPPVSPEIRFSLVRDTVGVFVGTIDRPGCTNIPPVTCQRKSGSFTWTDTLSLPMSGVSYIWLPRNIPTDISESEIMAVQAQPFKQQVQYNRIGLCYDNSVILKKLLRLEDEGCQL